MGGNGHPIEPVVLNFDRPVEFLLRVRYMMIFGPMIFSDIISKSLCKEISHWASVPPTLPADFHHGSPEISWLGIRQRQTIFLGDLPLSRDNHIPSVLGQHWLFANRTTNHVEGFCGLVKRGQL
jgi:hypothetical protein